MHISEAEDIISSLRRAIHKHWKQADTEISSRKPQKAISVFLKKLSLFQLQRRLLHIMTRKKDENFHKENFDHLVWQVAFQATKKGTEQRPMSVQELSVVGDSFLTKENVRTLKSRRNKTYLRQRQHNVLKRNQAKRYDNEWEKKIKSGAYKP